MTNTRYRKILLRESKRNKDIFWDIDKTKLQSLNDSAMVERLLNFGDIKSLKVLLNDIDAFKPIFKKIRSTKRQNLKPEVLSYVKKYLKKYVP